MAIKNRLKVILAEKNVNQTELLNELGISKSTLSNIINGKQNATLETALDLARILNTSVENIFYKEDQQMDGAEKDFVNLINKFNEVYKLYKSNVINETHLKNLYRDFIEDFNKKYNVAILDAYVNIHSDLIKDLNHIAAELLYGVY